MNLQSKLDQFRDDNPYDVDTQAKRLLAQDDKELILYTLALGLTAAKQRQRHYERDYIKNVGEAPPVERLIPRPGGGTGSVISIKVTPSKRQQNATKLLILNVWMVGDKKLGECRYSDLTAAIKREQASQVGHGKNVQLYDGLRAALDKKDKDQVDQKWNQETVRARIEKVYGEFRTTEAA